MGIFDDIKNAADANEDKVEAAIDQIGDFVDEKTGAEIERLVRVGPDLGSPGAQDDKAKKDASSPIVDTDTHAAS